MTWWVDLAAAQPTAHAVLTLSVVAVAGLAVGSISLRGVRLGSAGVLFAAIAVGHLGQRIDPAILAFLKEFGLVLFVFTIGLQIGPGFFAALRREGLRLNLLAVAIVGLGALVATASAALMRIDPFAALGLFSGATTNTPSLGAAQQVLATLPGTPEEKLTLPALAYAVAYPAAIVGIIVTLLVLRVVFRIDPEREAQLFRSEQQRAVEALERMNFRVENPNLEGIPIGEVPGLRETGVVVSRVWHGGEAGVRTATEDTVLHVGDLIHGVGTRRGLERFRLVVGSVADVDLTQEPGQIAFRRLVVTRREVLGKPIGELALDRLHGVTVSRLRRADVEMTALPHLRLQFGDVLTAIGPEAALDKAAGLVGNSLRALNETQFIPIFLGIALGVLAGIRPFALPGLPVPVRLGLAGGPLIVAIALGRLGHVGRLVWHMPASANTAFRELGITLFLACVGLQVGEHFFATFFGPAALAWLGAGVAITVVPILAVGIVARAAFKLNYMTLSGLLAGSMTDPPALAFASALGRSDAPTFAYATVYPLTMLLRILVAQILALTLCT